MVGVLGPILQESVKDRVLVGIVWQRFETVDRLRDLVHEAGQVSRLLLSARGIGNKDNVGLRGAEV
jgi:hypothetical protein